MSARLISILTAAVVVLGLAPPVAEAGTLVLAPIVQGAGTIVGDPDYDCTQTNGYNDDAQTKCASQIIDGSPVASIWLQAYPADVPQGGSDWVFAGWVGCNQKSTDGAECYVESDSTGSVERNPIALFVDTRAPTLALSGLPTGRVGGTTAKPVFSSPDTLASFRCRFDGAPFAACASGTEYTLADGPHRFSVVAVDPSGNVGAEHSGEWEVDAAPPTVALTGGPDEGSATTSRSASFEVIASPDTRSTTCALNGAPCSLPITLSSLADGPYTLVVTVTDGVREASATRTWTIDTVAPDTSVGAGFAFGASEAGVTYECSLDGAAFGACPSAAALNAQPAGAHRLGVRARDRAGNVDATPATFSWRVSVLGRSRAITITVPYFVSARRASTIFQTLSVKGVPAGATVRVTCKGGCPRRSLTIKSTKGGTVALKAFRHKPLKVGATLTIAVTKAGMTGMAKVFTIRAGRRPSVKTKTLR